MITKTSNIKDILCEMKDIHIIEIGVYQAQNAKECLKNFDIKTYVLIDPYIVLDYLSKYFGTEKIIKNNKKIAHRNLRKFEKKKDIELIWIEEVSEKAAKTLPDNSFDVVYIDGNHDYDYVLKDIENYVPKLKIGGIIIGDDYYEPKWHNYVEKNKLTGRGLPGVTEAVKKYCSEHGQTFNIAYPINKEHGGPLKFWWRIS